MDHVQVRDALELAALEAGALDRLMAGDTPEAAAVAGHLAGCPACATELERLRRAVPLLRDVIRTTPAPELRERTLSFVRERGTARAPAAPAGTPGPTLPARRASDGDERPAPRTSAVADAARREIAPLAVPDRASSPLSWVAAIAAAVVLSVLATSLLLGGRFEQQQRAIAGLEAVTAATISVTTEPDARRVDLAGAAQPAASGSLLFSPGTTELVVVARGLERPATGREFRCWLEVDGERQVVGRMYFAGELAYWVGETPEVAALAGGADVRFGVSLVDVGAATLDTDPVLVGQL